MTGAASDQVIAWRSTDCADAHQMVRRLQMRIAKAVREGRRGRVTALQRLLTHSFYGKAIAVKRVTENQGKTTPGVDGETWDRPDKKSRGSSEHPAPFKRGFSVA
jgi:RNA-directed DNA polymerase